MARTSGGRIVVYPDPPPRETGREHLLGTTGCTADRRRSLCPGVALRTLLRAKRVLRPSSKDRRSRLRIHDRVYGICARDHRSQFRRWHEGGTRTCSTRTARSPALQPVDVRACALQSEARRRMRNANLPGRKGHCVISQGREHLEDDRAASAPSPARRWSFPCSTTRAPLAPNSCGISERVAPRTHRDASGEAATPSSSREGAGLSILSKGEYCLRPGTFRQSGSASRWPPASCGTHRCPCELY